MGYWAQSYKLDHTVTKLTAADSLLVEKEKNYSNTIKHKLNVRHYT